MKLRQRRRHAYAAQGLVFDMDEIARAVAQRIVERVIDQTMRRVVRQWRQKHERLLRTIVEGAAL